MVLLQGSVHALVDHSPDKEFVKEKRESCKDAVVRAIRFILILENWVAVGVAGWSYLPWSLVENGGSRGRENESKREQG